MSFMQSILSLLNLNYRINNTMQDKQSKKTVKKIGKWRDNRGETKTIWSPSQSPANDLRAINNAHSPVSPDNPCSSWRSCLLPSVPSKTIQTTPPCASGSTALRTTDSTTWTRATTIEWSCSTTSLTQCQSPPTESSPTMRCSTMMSSSSTWRASMTWFRISKGSEVCL